MEVLTLLVALASLAVNVMVYWTVTRPTTPDVQREPTPLPEENPLPTRVLGRPLSMTRTGVIIQKLRDGGELE